MFISSDHDWYPFLSLWVLRWSIVGFHGLNSCLVVWIIYTDQVCLMSFSFFIGQCVQSYICYSLLTCLYLACSVRTPISMKFFPRFFLLYFLVFHIYFFSYAYGMTPSPMLILVSIINFYFHSKIFVQLLPGFSYLALSTTAAFMQHLILYFWNRFEVILKIFCH